MPFYSPRVLSLMLVVTVLSAYCYHWFWIRPREIIKPRTATFASNKDEDQNKEVQEDVSKEFQVSRMPYKEDTIVNIISDIYRIYLKLNYISDWEVTWAPPQGHAINQALCEELHLDPIVISLMKQLPYFRYSGIASDIEFFYPYSRAFVYLEDYEIRGGRDPDRFEYATPRPDLLLPYEIALTNSIDEGVHLILDTKENTIRVWSFNEVPPGPDIDNYRNYYPHHAPTYLASYLQKIRSLEIIPGGLRTTRQLYNKHYLDIYPKIKKILQEQYGWPYDFQQGKWKADAKTIWARIERNDPDYETDNDDELEPEVLRGGKHDPTFSVWHAFHDSERG